MVTILNYRYLHIFCVTLDDCVKYLQDIVRSLLEDMRRETSFGFWNDCIQACFELSDAYKDLEWIRLARAILQYTPEALQRDLDYMIQSVYCIISSAAHHHHHHHDIYVSPLA